MYINPRDPRLLNMLYDTFYRYFDEQKLWEYNKTEWEKTIHACPHDWQLLIEQYDLTNMPIWYLLVPRGIIYLFIPPGGIHTSKTLRVTSRDMVGSLKGKLWHTSTVKSTVQVEEGLDMCWPLNISINDLPNYVSK